jgi:hypothetical protein
VTGGSFQRGQRGGVGLDVVFRLSQGQSEEKPVVPRTKPQPRWCPVGLTKTQRRRVQKLRAQKVKEKEKEVQRDSWFN